VQVNILLEGLLKEGGGSFGNADAFPFCYAL
jgi:hypothetical protein